MAAGGSKVATLLSHAKDDSSIPFRGVDITALWRVMIKQCTGHQRRSIIGKQSLIRL